MSATDTTTTPAPASVRLDGPQVRLCAQALAWRYGTQTDVDSVVNGWLLDLLPRFCGPVAQRDGMHHSLMGAHARTVRRALTLYSDAGDGIPAGWRLAAGQLWQALAHARYRAVAAGHRD